MNKLHAAPTGGDRLRADRRRATAAAEADAEGAEPHPPGAAAAAGGQAAETGPMAAMLKKLFGKE